MFKAIHCQLMYLRIFETCALNNINSTLLSFFIAPGLGWQAACKKNKVKLDPLNDTDMILMAEKDGRCDAIYLYVRPNNKTMKNYDKIEESSYLKYWDVNNLYGWAMSKKLPYTSQFTADYIKNYNENSDEG